MPQARISLTLSRHFSQSLIASGRFSGLYPVSLHNCWMYVRAGRPAFARPYVGVHRSTSLMSSSLLLDKTILLEGQSSSSSCRTFCTDIPDSLVFNFYFLSFPAGFLDKILCPFRAVIDKFLLIGEKNLRIYPCEEVHGSTSLMRSSLLLQRYPSCLVLIIWMVLMMVGWLPLFRGKLLPGFVLYSMKQSYAILV